jgi:Na+-transporting NADH:ubiquinone oxidoreductase subunit NqrC
MILHSMVAIEKKNNAIIGEGLYLHGEGTTGLSSLIFCMN